jgi:hypothetical protein
MMQFWVASARPRGRRLFGSAPRWRPGWGWLALRRAWPATRRAAGGIAAAWLSHLATIRPPRGRRCHPRRVRIAEQSGPGQGGRPQHRRGRDAALARVQAAAQRADARISRAGAARERGTSAGTTTLSSRLPSRPSLPGEPALGTECADLRRLTTQLTLQPGPAGSASNGSPCRPPGGARSQRRTMAPAEVGTARPGAACRGLRPRGSAASCRIPRARGCGSATRSLGRSCPPGWCIRGRGRT